MFRLGIKVQGRPLLKLTTVGAHSAKLRTTVLGWFPDENRTDSWIVVASAAGSARHPGWAYNLAKHPDKATLDAGEGPVDVGAQLLIGSERDETWARVVEMAPGYGVYRPRPTANCPFSDCIVWRTAHRTRDLRRHRGVVDESSIRDMSCRSSLRPPTRPMTGDHRDANDR